MLSDRLTNALTENYRPTQLLRYAGLFTWLCASIPLIWMFSNYPSQLDQERYVGWWILHLVFGLTYWNLVRELPLRTPLPHRLFAAAVLSLSAVGISLMSQSGLGGLLLLLVAGLLPWIFGMVWAWTWLLAQCLALAIALATVPNVSYTDAAMTAGLFMGISLFAFMSSVVGLRQHAARDELRKLNSELHATQALLADNTRIAERVRIARELHDLVGHHLTALTLNLEVATHLVEGKALEHVQQARSLAKLLLADVREVVSDMRDNDKVDLAAALGTLVEGVPEPVVHLDLPRKLAMLDPVPAQVLLRCAQEAITNSVRHAGARNLWIRLVQDENGVALAAHDDGRGSSDLAVGNGLSGMQERLQQLGGELRLESSPGAGFSLHAWLPLEANS
ncbi:MAG TPA: sensor histidine kinase [Xanthomonadales bacterium]|nr:sensor histidine kinase [Xanthomonadales bacterium]